MNNTLFLCEPQLEDEIDFLTAMQASQSLHHPWVYPPANHEEFIEYIQRFKQANQKGYLLCQRNVGIVGIFNFSEIVRGGFQNAYLGFYAVAGFDNKGYMSQGLKLALKKAFTELGLHRIEANIQPANTKSINLVKANGFRLEGFSPHYLKVNGAWRDHERWAMTMEDWARLI